MKPKEFKVTTMYEFQELVEKKDFNISKAIVDSIIQNIKTRKKLVHVMSVKCVKEDEIIDITLEKIHFVNTLKENIKYFEEREMYEECTRIYESIQYLSKPKISDDK
jgi:hypothetical protein